MARNGRSYWPGSAKAAVEDLRDARRSLCAAERALRFAGAPKALAKVEAVRTELQRALKSTEGAVRNAEAGYRFQQAVARGRARQP